MSEQERDHRSADDERYQTDDVEAHRRHPGMTDDQNASEDESSEDFEAHKKR